MSDIQFHHASVLEAVLDLIEDGEGGHMTVEWGSRTADYERYDHEGVASVVVRARSGSASQIVSSDLWMAIRRWSVLDAPRASFVYHAESELYPTAVTIVADKLDRFAAGVATEEDRRAVRMIGVAPDARCLRHTRIRARSGPVGLMVAGIRWRVQRLIEPLWPRPDPEADAVAPALDQLLECCRPDRDKVRTLTQDEACDALGVTPERLSDGPAWSTAQLERYTSQLGSHLSGMLGDECPEGGDRPAPRVVPAASSDSPGGEPITGVLSHPAGAAISGPAGPEMAASIDALSRAAVDAGAIPFVVHVAHYRYRSLVTSVRTRLESATGYRVGATAARRFLTLPRLVLLLDGALASTDSEAALIEDLHPFRAHNPSARVVLLGMASRSARLLNLPLFRLEGSVRAVASGVDRSAADPD